MRFSATTLWLDVKVRLTVTGLIFAIGFYGGLIHKIFTQAYWPGTEALAGLLTFLGLGTLLGLRLPRLGENAIPRLKPGLLNRKDHPVALAGITFTLLTVIVLLMILVGALMTRQFAYSAAVLPERFVLNPFSWRLLTFLLPLIPAGTIGVLLGLILDLSFTLFIYRQCPNRLRSEQPEVLQVVCSLLIWIFLALGLSWLLGFYLAEIFLDRWFILILLPAIACLATILLSLMETQGESHYHKQIGTRANLLYSSFPELAGGTRIWASLSMVVLGWFILWNAIHWTYAVSNWYGADLVNPDQSLGMGILAVIAAVIGLKIGFALALKKAGRTSIIDRQGSALAVLGISLMLAAVATNYVLKAEHILTLYPQLVIPLVLAGQLTLWGISFGLIVPSLATGRPNRFDLWIELASKLTLGVILTGLLYLIWQYWEIGNLLAISLASLLAIAFGGVVIIYNEPRDRQNRKKLRSARILHFSFIAALYLSLIFITVIVPHLKYSWFRPTMNSETIVSEGRAGVAYLSSNGKGELAWANRITFPDRVHPELRTESQALVRQIIKLSAEENSTSVRALIVGFPFLTSQSLTDLPIRRLDQMDIDQAIRKLEFKYRDLDPNTPAPDLLDLSCRLSSYHVVIVMIPTPWPKGQTWPNAIFLLNRLFALSQSHRGVWIVSLTRDQTQNQTALLHSLPDTIKKPVTSDLLTKILPGKTDFLWQISSFSPSLNQICLENSPAQ